MEEGNRTINPSDPCDSSRFTKAREGVYHRALSELRGGRKQSHWIWFVFPQIEGLGHGSTARFYPIKSREEAKAYLKHPVLGVRLAECAETLPAIEGRSATAIFGYADNVKLKSSMTLFASLAAPESAYELVLDKYFNGNHDQPTLQLLERMKEGRSSDSGSAFDR